MGKGKKIDHEVQKASGGERGPEETRELSAQNEAAPEYGGPDECIVEDPGEDRSKHKEDAASTAEQTAEAPAVVSVAVAEIEQLKKSNEEYHEKLLRMAAEFDNYRKRIQKERLSWEECVKESVVKELLLVMDNFDRAVEAIKSGQGNDGITDGVIIIHQQLVDVLKRMGVEHFSAVGEKFDPNKHEALLKLESEEYPEDIITQELVKGYRLKDRVIRPARVTISAGIKKTEETQQAE